MSGAEATRMGQLTIASPRAPHGPRFCAPRTFLKGDLQVLFHRNTLAEPWLVNRVAVVASPLQRGARCEAAGEHERGGHSNGGGAGMERARSGARQFRLLLGLLAHPDPRRLGVHQVRHLASAPRRV